MLTLTVTAALAALVRSAEDAGESMRSVQLRADDWAGAVAEIRERFPRLAERILTVDSTLRPGFLLAINDVVVSANEDLPGLHSGDEVVVLVQIAGG